MKTCEALNRLYEHQAVLLDHIDGACSLLQLDPPVAQPRLAKARWELVRRLRAYQLFKHTEIFDPALASGSPQQIAAARQMKVDCIAAGETFRGYVLEWSGRDVITEWDAYSLAMRRVAGDLRNHIAGERQNVTRFLSGVERTRKLSAAAPLQA
jgi:hypothetical protein